MTEDILIRFLRIGLINVGGDDTKLEKLRQASADLATALKETPSKATPFTLVAIDPEAPTDDPVVQEAVKALQNSWATYANTFSGTPVSVIRALLLDALIQVAADDHYVGLAFVSSARNVLPYMEVGNESTIWTDVIGETEKRVNARAEAEWAMPESISIPTFAISPIRANQDWQQNESKVDKDDLAEKFTAAAGPQNTSGPTNGNPYWPQVQSAAWNTEFGNRMAEAVTEAIAAVAEASQSATIDLSGSLQDIAKAVSTHVDKALEAVTGATAGLQRRTNLIWWKETLYSPSASASYREMSGSTAAALMAYDLHLQMPTFAPSSVTAYLHEAVLSLPSIDQKLERPIRDLLNEATKAQELQPLREAAVRLVPEPLGRRSLVSLFNDPGQPLLNDVQFRAKVGVPAATPLTTSAWAAWLFRELQAARATQSLLESK